MHPALRIGCGVLIDQTPKKRVHLSGTYMIETESYFSGALPGYILDLSRCASLHSAAPDDTHNRYVHFVLLKLFQLACSRSRCSQCDRPTQQDSADVIDTRRYGPLSALRPSRVAHLLCSGPRTVLACTRGGRCPITPRARRHPSCFAGRSVGALPAPQGREVSWGSPGAASAAPPQ
jgi:hypothetical protein